MNPKIQASNFKKHPVSIALVGISGMGHHYLNTLLEEFSPDAVEICAAIDPYPDKSERYKELKDRGIPIYQSLNEFYEDGHTAELTVISSPHHFHVSQSCEAIRHESYVLCEKPVAAVIQDADYLIQIKDDSDCWVMIGYQWSYSAAIQALKKDILKGKLGKPVRLKAFYLWGRDEAYFKRNNWAGKTKDEEDNWILDSPANSAMAHDLHNMFYVLGDRIDRGARPAEVTAELYRAYSIENFDSIACRVFTDEEVELLFYASHAILQDQGPLFSFEFEEATVTFGESTSDIVAKDHKGREKHYGTPEAEHPLKKLFEAVDTVRDPKPVLCGPEAARPQVLCVNGIQESVPEIITFPDDMVHKDAAGKLWVKGLSEAFYDCYQKGILPSEAEFSWAQQGNTIKLRNYRFFPGRIPHDEQENT